MQEIITEILERLGFPTKNIEELMGHLCLYADKDKLLGLSVITQGGLQDGEIIGYNLCHRDYLFNSATSLPEWRYCSIGSELVARLKGGEA